jgi:prepilin-type N-terminal cleavage/methylation domain-containing protein
MKTNAVARKALHKKEDGFTLIEIIAVLVIMGILAAVAVPKFYDLQDRAMDKAISSAEAEIKVRVNQHFAKQLLEGATSSGAITYTFADVIGTAEGIGKDFIVDTWAFDGANNKITYRIQYGKNFHDGDAGNDVVMKTENLEIDTPQYFQ